MLNSYIALDLETTGLKPKHDRIIEIGAIKVRDGKEIDTFQSLLRPGRRLPEHIIQLTGITDELLEEAPEAGEVIPELLDFIGEDVILGHRILFDFSFVKRAAVNLGYSFEKKGMDTLKLARKFLPQLESRRLGSLCQYFGIPEGGHRALEDARAASMLYQKLAEKFDLQEIEPVSLVYQTKKETPITKSQKERLTRLLERHKIVPDQYDFVLPGEIESLTRNEADRVIDRILAVHGRS